MKNLIAIIAMTAGITQVLVPEAIKAVTPVLRAAVEYQDATIATAQDLSCGRLALAQWEPKRKIALERIEHLEALATNLQIAHSDAQ